MSEIQKNKNGQAITAFVLGIIALVSTWMPNLTGLAFVIAIIGLIFGIVGLVRLSKVKANKTYAITALIINIAAIVILLSTQSVTLHNVIFQFNQGFNEGYTSVNGGSFIASLL